MFMNPMPSQAWYNRFYAQEFWEEKSVKSGVEQFELQEDQALKELKRAQIVFRFLSDSKCLPPEGARILEVGCAFGLIGRSIAVRFGGVAFGAEPSDSASAFAKQHVGVDIVARGADDLEHWDPSAPVNLVIFSHVIENIVDPLAVLSQVYRLLGPQGLLYIETPNPVFQRSTSIYHPYIYSARAIKHLVRRAGFDVKVYETNGLPRNSVVPRFQRLVAIKGSKPDSALPPPKPGMISFPLRRRAGLSFWRLGKAFRQKAMLDETAESLFAEVKKSMREKPDATAVV